MAATAGQERWKGSRSMRERAKAVFAPGKPDRVGGMGDLRSAVSPHWKRIAARSIAGVEEDFIVRKRRRKAVLSSDFRFVSAANKAERSARLESEFERFSNSFGREEMEMNLERDRRTKRVRFLENEDLDEKRGDSQSDDYPSSSISNAMDDCTYESWNPTTTMPLRIATQEVPESYETVRQDNGFWPGNPLSLNSVESLLPSWSETNQDPIPDSTSISMDITPESSTYLETLSISSYATKSTAILRLHEIETHLSHAQEQESKTPSIDNDEHRYPLISVSLDTFTNGPPAETSYFYCPQLECHRRLVYQNANLPLHEGQRCCVHTDCGFVSHDLKGWVKHCTSSHHEFAEHGMGCGCCYSNEDTH